MIARLNFNSYNSSYLTILVIQLIFDLFVALQQKFIAKNQVIALCGYFLTGLKKDVELIHLRWSLFLYVYICLPLFPHPPPVLSVQRWDHLAPVQEQSRGTSHSMIFCLGLDDCFSTVTQYAVLFPLQRDVPQGIPPYTGMR